MTLMQLKVFVIIAELGNVTRAAEALGITQSAASAALAALENTNEVRLFNRVGRSVELSEIGRRFLPEAQAVVSNARNASQHLRSLGGKTKGKLVIAASQTIANYWLPGKLAKFKAQFPDVTLNMKISNTRDVENALLKKHADIGFVEGQVVSDQLNLSIIDHDQPALVVSARFWPSIRKKNMSIELAKLPWIIREPGSGTREILENLAKQKGLKWSDLNIVLELPSNESVREAVEAGAGATLISQHVVNSAIKTGSLRAIQIDFPPREYQMVLRKEGALNDAGKMLTKMVSGIEEQPYF